MLIPDKNGHYYSDGMRVVDYHAMVDGFFRVIEVFTTEDGKKWLQENEWSEMNDIEKHICRKRGWNLDKYISKD